VDSVNTAPGEKILLLQKYEYLFYAKRLRITTLEAIDFRSNS